MSAIKITDDNYNTVSINEFDMDTRNEYGNNKNIIYYGWDSIWLMGEFNDIIKLSGTTFSVVGLIIMNGGFNEFSMGTKGEGTLVICATTGRTSNSENLYITVPIRIGNNNQNSTLKEILNMTTRTTKNKKLSPSDAKKIDVQSLIPKSEYYRYDNVSNNGESIRQIMFDIKDSLIISRTQYERILSKFKKNNQVLTTITRNSNGYTPLVKNKIGTKDVALKDSLFTCVPVECDGDICQDAEGNPFYDEDAAKKKEKKSSAIAEFLGGKQDSLKKLMFALLSILLCVGVGYLMYKIALKFVMFVSTGGTGGVRARVIDAR